MIRTEEAVQLIKEKKYEEAAKILNDIIETYPHEASGYIKFGNLLIKAKDYALVKVFFKRVIELDDQAAIAYYSLANVYYEEELLTKAQTSYQKAIECGLVEGDVYFMLGLTLI